MNLIFCWHTVPNEVGAIFLERNHQTQSLFLSTCLVLKGSGRHRILVFHAFFTCQLGELCFLTCLYKHTVSPVAQLWLMKILKICFGDVHLQLFLCVRTRWWGTRSTRHNHAPSSMKPPSIAALAQLHQDVQDVDEDVYDIHIELNGALDVIIHLHLLGDTPGVKDQVATKHQGTTEGHQ